MARRRKEWSPSSDSFEKLLLFLDPDRAQAGERYELLRSRLIVLFERRGCTRPDEVADDTFSRVESLLDQGREVEPKNREGFIIQTGKYVLQEYWDKQRIEPGIDPAPPETPTAEEVREEIFNLCLGQLPDNDRELLLKYLQVESGSEGVKPKLLRERLAQQEGTSIGTLRLRIFRIRESLTNKCQCCAKCLDE